MELWRWNVPREFFDVNSPVKPILKVSNSGRVVLASSIGAGEWGVFYLDGGRLLWRREYERVLNLCLSGSGNVAVLNERGFGMLNPQGEGKLLGAGGSDMVCSAGLSIIYVYDSSDGTLVAATSQGKVVRDMHPLHGADTLLGTSPDGRIPVGVSSTELGVILTFFDFIWEEDFSKVFKVPPGGRVEGIYRPAVANDGTVAFAVTYSAGGSKRNAFILFKGVIDLYMEAPGDAPFSYALSDDGEFLVVVKGGEGVYGYRRNRPLWNFRKGCRRVELGKERVLVECFNDKGEKFPVPHVLDISGEPVWVGKERVVTSSISRNGKLVAYVDVLGRLKVIEIG
jgi:hypothetical protein